MASASHWTEDLRQLPRLVERLETSMAVYRNLDKMILRLYYGRPIAVPIMDTTRPSQSLQAIDGAKASGFSLVREVIDAASSLVVRPTAVKMQSVGETFKRQRGAKLGTKLVSGVFYANEFDEAARRMFLDGATCRLGAVKWFVDEDTKELKVERLNPLYLLWDEAEGQVPNSLHYESPVPRRYLRARYPEKASEIDRVPRWDPPTVPWIDLITNHEADRVKVIESWSLPLGDKPGKHVIQCGELTLVDEKWKHSRFPIVVYRWSPSWSSFAGRPLGEILIPYQLWTNKITRVIGEAQRGCVPKLIVNENAFVDSVSDKAWEKVLWHGPIAPSFSTPQGLNPEIYQWREAIKREAYEEAGVSMSLAQGTKPPGLTSGVAQREHADIASTRLLDKTLRMEQVYRESAQVILMLAADAYKNSKSARIKAPGTRLLEEFDWADFDLKEDEYSVQACSVSALPLTVAARLDLVMDLKQQGMIEQKDALRLIRMPDTDAMLDRVNAPMELADAQVEAALWEGRYLAPEPIQDLDVLLATATRELMRALQNGNYPEDNLELCRRLIAEARLLQGPPPSQAPQGQPPMPAPGGQPPSAPPAPSPAPGPAPIPQQ